VSFRNPQECRLFALLRGSTRAVVFGTALAALGIFLALGENTGLYAFAFTTVPGFDTFRVPARWLLLWEFGAAILAAAGADWVARGSQVYLRSRWLWARFGLLVVLLVVALSWQQFDGEPFASRRTPVMFVGLVAATILIGALPHLGKPTLAVGLLVMLTGAEVWAAANASPARQAPPAAFVDGQTVDWFRAHSVTAQERLLSLARPEYVPASEAAVREQLAGLPEPLINQVLVAQKWHDTLTPNVPLQYGLNTADGYDGGVLPLLRWLDLSGLVVQSPRPDGVLLTRLDQVPPNQILDLLGVRYLITNATTPVPTGLQVIDFGDLHLLARPDPVPLSLVVFGVTPVADESAALSRMAAPSFDSNREVVVEGVSAAAPPGAAPMSVAPDTVTPERWHAYVALTQPGFLLQREAWYPGWRARVDGADVPLQHADGLFRGLPLSAGDHDVEIYFDSTSFNRGALLSLAGMVVIIVLLVWRPILRTRVQN
jgi:hypothetical protein